MRLLFAAAYVLTAADSNCVAPTHSLFITGSLTHTPSLAHLLARSPTHSLTCSLGHSLFHSLTAE